MGLAARPDQVVRAALAFDQAGVDRGRERRIVEGRPCVVRGRLVRNCNGAKGYLAVPCLESPGSIIAA
jgi:hypothetical protein